ncbi:MAG: hypothetical protein O3A25_18315 [Acidobacteria bacterium]|nr:hypothetical protein [Acidobacteriota bacterium]
MTVVETWRRDFHVDGITCETMVPHFEACEAVARVSPLRAPAPPSSLRLQEGSNRLGWRCAEVPRLVVDAPLTEVAGDQFRPDEPA